MPRDPNMPRDRNSPRDTNRPGRVGKDAEQRELLERAFRAAVAAADPGRITPEMLPPVPTGRLMIVGAGKAAATMAQVVERHYGPAARLEGHVIVPNLGAAGYAATNPPAAPPSRIEVALASHPTPDERGHEATRTILELVSGCGPEDEVIVLLSGGGSSLLVAPDGLELYEKVEVTEALLRSGARIEEINTVRKHLSKVKGGRLALAAHPGRVTTLVLSDVVGDDLSAVASGPTVPDPTTYADALEVLERYGIGAQAARRVLEEGRAGARPETPKPGDGRLEGVKTHLIGNNQGSLEVAARLLEDAGYHAHILSSAVVGEAREAGRVHAAIARQVLDQGQPFPQPCALLSGGETTVTVQGKGRGGRNSEFALGLALELPPHQPVWALAADTDGRDGSEANAGVFVTPRLLATINSTMDSTTDSTMDRRKARAALDANDSYTVFASTGHLLETGPTGTNVNDLRIILVGAPD